MWSLLKKKGTVPFCSSFTHVSYLFFDYKVIFSAQAAFVFVCFSLKKQEISVVSCASADLHHCESKSKVKMQIIHRFGLDPA